MKIVLAIVSYLILISGTFLLGAFVQKNYDLISTRHDATDEEILQTQKALMYQIQRIAPLQQKENSDTTAVDYTGNNVTLETRSIDLNNDGIDEVMERKYSSELCGASNCPTTVYQVINGQRKALMEVAAQSFPLVLSTQTLSFSDLQFGPDAAGRITVWKWNGTKYEASK